MDLSNNSGLIKFLDDNRDSYEERVSLTCHQNASYVNRIALFPPVPQSPPRIDVQSLACNTVRSVTFYLCDIFGIRPWLSRPPRRLSPLLTLREILSECTTPYLLQSHPYAPCKSSLDLRLVILIILKVTSRLKDWIAKSVPFKFYCIYLDVLLLFHLRNI